MVTTREHLATDLHGEDRGHTCWNIEKKLVPTDSKTGPVGITTWSLLHLPTTTTGMVYDLLTLGAVSWERGH